MTLPATSAPWMCISIGCASGFPRNVIHSASEPSEGWGTVWRWFHEGGTSTPGGCDGGVPAAPAVLYGDWRLFPDGVALPHPRPCSSTFPGAGYQCTAWCRPVRPAGSWHLRLDQFEATSKAQVAGAL